MTNELLLMYRSSATEPLLDPVDETIPYLPIDKHLAASLLQKAIRRGQRRWALQAGYRLFDLDPARFWRRLAVILFEDVGLGDLELAAELIASAPMRGQAGVGWPQITRLISRLCETPKTQAANNLMHLGLYDFGEAEPLVEIPELAFEDAALWLNKDYASLVQKTKVAWMLSGVGLGYSGSPVKHPQADRERLLHALEPIFNHQLLHAVVRRGLQLTQLALPLAAGFIWCADQKDINIWGTKADLAPSVLILNELPSWVYDMYTLSGKRSLRRTAVECPAIAQTLETVAKTSQAKLHALCSAHFEHESAILSKRIANPVHISLYKRVRATGLYGSLNSRNLLYEAFTQDWDAFQQIRREEVFSHLQSL